MAVSGAIPVDPGNREQLQAWNGAQGAYWAAHADHFERALARYEPAVLDAASIGATDRVLDVGCGTGRASRAAARAASSGSVLGIDLSAEMLAVARRRAADDGLGNVRFEQADAQIHRFEPDAFDVALSVTGAMFFADRVAGLANVGRGLRRGGRLVLLTWQPYPLQEWMHEFSTALAAGRPTAPPPSDAPGPFSLSDPGVVQAVLDAAGYDEVMLEDRREPMWFGVDADDGYEFVLGQLGWMLEGLDDDDRAAAQRALHGTISAHTTSDGVLYDSAAWVVRARRR